MRNTEHKFALALSIIRELATIGINKPKTVPIHRLNSLVNKAYTFIKKHDADVAAKP